MKDIIKKWKQFAAWWDETHLVIIDGQKKILKPSFFDFMDWLAMHEDINL